MKKSQLQKFPLRKGLKTEEGKKDAPERKTQVGPQRSERAGTPWKSPWDVAKAYKSEGSQGIMAVKEGSKWDAQIIKRRLPTSAQQKKAPPTPHVGLKTTLEPSLQLPVKGDGGDTTTSIESSEVSSQPSEKDLESESETTSEESSETDTSESQDKEQSDRVSIPEQAPSEQGASDEKRVEVLDEVYNTESTRPISDIVSDNDFNTGGEEKTERIEKVGENLSFTSEILSGSANGESEIGVEREECESLKEVYEIDEEFGKTIEIVEDNTQMEDEKFLGLEKEKEEETNERASLEEEIVDLRAQNEELRQEVIRLMKCLLEKTALLVKYRGAVDELGGRVKQLLRKDEDDAQDSSDNLEEGSYSDDSSS